MKNINLDEMEDAEERRLFYVALTRAKKKIFVISNSSRPSKYLDEIKTRLNLNDLLKKRTEENKIDKKNNWLIFSGTAVVASVVVLILSL